MPVSELVLPFATQGELTREKGQRGGECGWEEEEAKRRKERKCSGREKGDRGHRRNGDEDNGRKTSVL